jgi:hypothetical protein
MFRKNANLRILKVFFSLLTNIIQRVNEEMAHAMSNMIYYETKPPSFGKQVDVYHGNATDGTKVIIQIDKLTNKLYTIYPKF